MDKRELKEKIQEWKKCCKQHDGWKSTLEEQEVLKQERAVQRKKVERQLSKTTGDSRDYEDYCSIVADDYADTLLYKEMFNGVKYVESTFDDIEEKHGKEARDALWARYVAGEDDSVIEKKTGRKMRTLRNNKNKWLEDIL